MPAKKSNSRQGLEGPAKGGLLEASQQWRRKPEPRKARKKWQDVKLAKNKMVEQIGLRPK